MSKVLFLVNQDTVVYNIRLELVERLLQDGHKVVISSPYGEYIDKLIKLGCEFYETNLSRHGTNPVAELRLISDYRKVIKAVAPDVVLTYSIKPNVYGGMVCASLGIPYVVNITGRGVAVDGGLLQKITLILYRHGLKKAKKVFFQNSDDLAFMQRERVVSGDYELIPGSGVNLERNCFEPYPEDDGTETFLFIGRLCEVKGIKELVGAAKFICAKYDNVRFIAVGSCEPDYQKKLRELEADKYIYLAGKQDNVHEWIKQATAIVHPSYLEGMANALLEAAASGRPVIASDVPGCRETFDEGISGLGFQPRDVGSLCGALEKFIALPYEVKVRMGHAGRQKMEREFDRQIVVDKYMELIEQIGVEKGHGAAKGEN